MKEFYVSGKITKYETVNIEADSIEEAVWKAWCIRNSDGKYGNFLPHLWKDVYMQMHFVSATLIIDGPNRSTIAVPCGYDTTFGFIEKYHELTKPFRGEPANEAPLCKVSLKIDKEPDKIIPVKESCHISEEDGHAYFFGRTYTHEKSEFKERYIFVGDYDYVKKLASSIDNFITEFGCLNVIDFKTLIGSDDKIKDCDFKVGWDHTYRRPYTIERINERISVLEMDPNVKHF